MASRTTEPPGKRRSPSVSALRARMIATAYSLTHYGSGCVPGQPRRISVSKATWWVVPVDLAYPGIVVGEVGFIAVDAASGAIVGSTPRTEVRAAARRIAEENGDAIQAAFLQARKA